MSWGFCFSDQLGLREAARRVRALLARAVPLLAVAKPRDGRDSHGKLSTGHESAQEESIYYRAVLTRMCPWPWWRGHLGRVADHVGKMPASPHETHAIETRNFTYSEDTFMLQFSFVPKPKKPWFSLLNLLVVSIANAALWSLSAQEAKASVYEGFGATTPGGAQLSRVGFLRGKGHLVYHYQFYIFVRRAGPQFGDETPRGQAPVVEQRHQDSDPALAKHADQAQPRHPALTGGRQESGWQQRQRADWEGVLCFPAHAEQPQGGYRHG